jgi:hypothetical protein
MEQRWQQLTDETQEVAETKRQLETDLKKEMVSISFFCVIDVLSTLFYTHTINTSLILYIRRHQSRPRNAISTSLNESKKRLFVIFKLLKRLSETNAMPFLCRGWTFRRSQTSCDSQESRSGTRSARGQRNGTQCRCCQESNGWY